MREKILLIGFVVCLLSPIAIAFALPPARAQQRELVWEAVADRGEGVWFARASDGTFYYCRSTPEPVCVEAKE